MPSKSRKQHNFMAAVAHSPGFAKAAGVPQSVGRDFVRADKHCEGGHVMGKTMQSGHNFSSDGRVVNTIRYARGGSTTQFTPPGPPPGVPRGPRAPRATAPGTPGAPRAPRGAPPMPAAAAALPGAARRMAMEGAPGFSKGGQVKGSATKGGYPEFEDKNSPIKHGSTFKKGGRARKFDEGGSTSNADRAFQTREGAIVRVPGSGVTSDADRVFQTREGAIVRVPGSGSTSDADRAFQTRKGAIVRVR
jgi:hypothetical protein